MHARPCRGCPASSDSLWRTIATVYTLHQPVHVVSARPGRFYMLDHAASISPDVRNHNQRGVVGGARMMLAAWAVAFVLHVWVKCSPVQQPRATPLPLGNSDTGLCIYQTESERALFATFGVSSCSCHLVFPMSLPHGSLDHIPDRLHTAYTKQLNHATHVLQLSSRVQGSGLPALLHPSSVPTLFIVAAAALGPRARCLAIATFIEAWCTTCLR